MSEGPRLHPVVSSNLKEVGYDAETRTLYVRFKGNPVALHAYDNVPPEVHRDLIGASSVGAYFHGHIKGKYSSIVRRPEDERRDE